MSFLPHWLLWGGLAASVPVAIHFFFRTKHRVVEWAAMDFLRASLQQTSRRLKFQELLLLLLRIALLILLALVLALGIVRATSKWGGGGAVDTVMIFDVSASMAAKEGTSTRLELAQKSALEILDQLPSSSTVQIITSADRAELRGPASPSSIEQARILIRSLRVTDLTTDHLPGLVEANQALRRVHNPNREVYLFSDMQQRGWQAQASALAEKAKEFNNDNTKLLLVRCAKSEPRNAAVVGIRPQSDLLHRGDRVAISVLVRNTGSHTLKNVNVKLAVVGQREGHDVRSLPELGPHQTRGLLLSIELQSAGYLVLRATIDGDELAQDNELHHVVRAHDRVRVLIVDGRPNQREPDESGSFYLRQALQPVADASREDYSVQVRVVPPNRAVPALLEDSDLCVLVDVPLKPKLSNVAGHLAVPFLDRLESFVRAGGGLLVTAGPQVEADGYNALLLESRGLLPAAFGARREAAAEQAFFAAADRIPNESFLATLRKDPLRSILARTEIRSFVELKPSKLARVELETVDREPLLVSGRLGDGRIVCCGTTCNLQWNDWGLWGHFYVPLWRSVLNELLAGPTDGLNRRVGEPILWQVSTEDAERDFVVANPEREVSLRGHPRLEDGTTRLSLDPLQHAGLYTLAAEGKRAEPNVTALHREDRAKKPGVLAIAPDRRESDDLAPMRDGEIHRTLGFEPAVLDATTGGMADVGEQRRQEWTLLLAAVLVLLLAETWLAWFCGRSI